MPEQYLTFRGRRFENLAGKTFGKLTVESHAGRGVHDHLWLCRCACGNASRVAGGNLRRLHTKSCGCEKNTGKEHRKHGATRTRTYRIWSSMLTRCGNPNCNTYYLYGGRGIKVCGRWKSFENFLADMGKVPPNMSIDRIDGNGNYEPENCRWATSKTQNRNRSANRMVTFQGRTLAIADWSDITNLKASTIAYRLRAGWSAERALSTPASEANQTLSEAMKAFWATGSVVATRDDLGRFKGTRRTGRIAGQDQ